jgi:hypothetical protein
VSLPRTGKIIHFQVFYHLCAYLSGARTWGVVPDLADRAIDIIPADYVARAIHCAVNCQETASRVFHLCSGASGSVSLAALAQLSRELHRTNEKPLPPPSRRGLRGVPYLLDYLDETQAFDNRVSRTLLDSLRAVATPLFRRPPAGPARAGNLGWVLQAAVPINAVMFRSRKAASAVSSCREALSRKPLGC